MDKVRAFRVLRVIKLALDETDATALSFRKMPQRKTLVRRAMQYGVDNRWGSKDVTPDEIEHVLNTPLAELFGYATPAESAARLLTSWETKEALREALHNADRTCSRAGCGEPTVSIAYTHVPGVEGQRSQRINPFNVCAAHEIEARAEGLDFYVVGDFRCPECGGGEWGTSNGQDMSIATGHCAGTDRRPQCHFSWKRSEDHKVFPFSQSVYDATAAIFVSSKES